MSKDTISVNMNVYDIPIVVELLKKLEQENKQLNSILTELEEYLQNHIEEWENSEDEYMMGVVAEDKDILNKLKEKYK